MSKFLSVLVGILLTPSAFASCPTASEFSIPLKVDKIVESADGKSCTYVNPQIEILNQYLKLIPTPRDPLDTYGAHDSDSAQGLCWNLLQNFVSFSWSITTPATVPFSKGVWFKNNGMVGGTDYFYGNYTNTVTCSNFAQ